MLAATIITAFIGSSIVAAAPADVSARQLTICSGTYSNAQCCATDVLGLADLNCANREQGVHYHYLSVTYIDSNLCSPDHSY